MAPCWTTFGKAPVDQLAHGDQPVEVDPGLEPHRFEHEGEVLGDDVAGRAGRVGTAAEPAQRGIEGARAGVERRQHIGEAKPARVVEMPGYRQRRDIGHDPAEDPLDRSRLTVADGVGEDDRIGAGLGDLDGDAAHPILVDRALDRAAEGGGEPAGDARAPVFRRGVAQRDDAAEILDQFRGAAADIRAVVPVADRQHKIHLVDAERQAALGALEVGDQRRDGEPGQRQRMAHHRLGIGELRQELGRDKRADLDLAHPGGVFGIEPGDLLLGRHDLGDALQSVAEPDFADMGTFAHSFLHARACSIKASPGGAPGQRSHTTCSGVSAQASSVSASSIWIVAC